MALEIGFRLGPYSVTAKIGEGGMGEVYRARDTKLDRDVALKVLPQAFTDDPDRLARFEREAKVLASLNHPNIGHIYGLEEAERQKALVLELVEGPTLADRIAQGPIPVDEALPIAKQIAEALEAAHEQGVIHRDLKPANIKVTPKGQVKILDFGIAKWENDGAKSAAMAPTAAATQGGMIVGTVQYMAPEQLQGKVIDTRADLFSLGVVLYEVATGTHPFHGESQAEWISSILRDTPPPVTALLGVCPEGLVEVLDRCLAKEAERRYPSTKALCEALAEVTAVPPSRIALPQPAARRTTYRTPLIGRETETRQLRSSLSRAGEGAGSLVTLAGEPGVGKTRLSTDLIDHARPEGFLSLVGHCYEGEGTRPFGPWVEVLETTARIAPRATLRELLGDAAPEIAKLLPTLRRLFPDLPPRVSTLTRNRNVITCLSASPSMSTGRASSSRCSWYWKTCIGLTSQLCCFSSISPNAWKRCRCWWSPPTVTWNWTWRVHLPRCCTS